MKEASLNVFGRFKEVIGALIRTKLCVNRHTHSHTRVCICERHVSINNLALKGIYNFYGGWQRNQIDCWDIQDESQNTKYLRYIFSLFYLPLENKTNKTNKEMKRVLMTSVHPKLICNCHHERKRKRRESHPPKRIFPGLLNWILCHCLFPVNKSILNVKYQEGCKHHNVYYTMNLGVGFSEGLAYLKWYDFTWSIALQ